VQEQCNACNSDKVAERPYIADAILKTV